MNALLCIFMLSTPMKNGEVWREYPMIKGYEIKESGDNVYVDFAVSLNKMKYNKKWNTQVRWVRRNDCISADSTN